MGIIVEFGVSGVAGKRRSKIAKIVRDDIPDIRGKMPEIADGRAAAAGLARLCCEIAAPQRTDGRTTMTAMERRPEMRRGKKPTLLVSRHTDALQIPTLRTSTTASLKRGRVSERVRMRLSD